MQLFRPELEVDPREGFTPDKDIFNRAPFGERLTSIVRTIEGPLVLLLDGGWGTGKTTFLKMWLGELSKLNIPNIYFDAFANDYHEDAFLTIAGEIIARAEELKTHRDKAVGAFTTSAIRVAKALGRASLRVSIRTASGGLLTGNEVVEIGAEAAKIAGEETAKAINELLKERLESHRADREAFDQFKVALANLAIALSSKSAKSNNKENDDALPDRRLVFIIDELDRCRPSFALDLLEKIEHLFSVPGVVFLLASSLRQLESAAQFAYGEIDGRSYLEEFYHMRILFPSDSKQESGQTASEKYLMHLFPGQEARSYIEIIGRFCRIHPLSLRTLERVIAYTKIASISLPKNSLVIHPIITALCIIKVIDPELYSTIRSGHISFEQVNATLRFADWRDEYEPAKQHRIGEIAEMWWRYVSGESVTEDQKRHIHHALFQYSVRNPEQIALRYCEIVDGFSFP